MGGVTKRPKKIWGLDLAGLGTGNNTGLAVIDYPPFNRNQIPVTLIRKHPFNKKIVGDTKLDAPVIEKLISCLRSWSNNENHLYVDIPICWQDLPKVSNPLFLWQTKKRVVDYVFDGLAPFAQLMGAQTADFRYLSILAGIQGNLGNTLFEAYPKATLKKIMKYPEREKNNGVFLDTLMKNLKISLESGNDTDPLNHDEVDAIVCAMAGALDFESLTETMLVKEWSDPDAKRMNYETIISERPNFFRPPKGYRVVPPSGIDWCSIEIVASISDWSE